MYTTFQVSDASEAKEYGIDELPGLLYFENKIPSMYDGELKDEDELLKWLIEQKMTDTIEEVRIHLVYLLFSYFGRFDDVIVSVHLHFI